MTTLTESKMQELESMIDNHGLDEVLIGILIICGDKADHIRASYNDKKTANVWEQAGKNIRKAAESHAVSVISK